MRNWKWTYQFLLLVLLSASFSAFGQTDPKENKTEELPYPISDDDGSFKQNTNSSNINFNDPSNVQKNVDYDPATNQYILSKTMGNGFYRDPRYISFQDYLDYEYKNKERQYWSEKSDIKSELLRRKVREKPNKDGLEDIFPEDFIQIKPSGSVEMSFALTCNITDNPALPRRLQRQHNFEYDQDIRANITGKIGDFISLKFNYDTKATFEFDEQLRIAYQGKEDQIVQKFEAGNIAFPLQTQLIQGTQSLFGFKTELQFGRLTLTSAIAQQRGKSESITIQGGAQRREFEIEAADYDANRHFFLSHFFRDRYEDNVANAPALNSTIRITRIEVWVTNDNRTAERSRDILAFMDLGEPDSIYNSAFKPNAQFNFDDGYLDFPSDSANELAFYAKRTRDQGQGVDSRLINGQYKMEKVIEFQNIYAKMLKESEYQVYPNLGYISLNRRLQNDEVLAVAFEYTYKGQIYRVGEFSNEKQAGTDNGLLILKMLKSTSLNPRLPMWDLMMKNVYSLNAYQVSRKNFFLNIYYQDPSGGDKRYLPTSSVRGEPLLEVLNLDRIDRYNQPVPNGMFDFIQGVTIDSTKGRMTFLTLEPFAGGYDDESIATGIRKAMIDNATNTAAELKIADQYAYDELYDSTITVAKNDYPEYNRYFIRGSYQSSVTNDISLNRMNIPQGSVNITAGGRKLQEGIDFNVDYVLGRVRILNESILNSGVPISVNFESSELFNMTQKRFLGTRADYWINDNFTLGGTLLNLKEGVITNKNDYGEEPVKNTIWGLDGTYSTEMPLLTKLVDMLPLLETKEKSSITFSAEYARLHPSYPKVTGQNSYIDDFEGSRNFMDLKGMGANSRWALASTPRGRDFPESSLYDSLEYGKNRANLSWYTINGDYYNKSRYGDLNVENDDVEGLYVKQFIETDIFKEKQMVMSATPLNTLDLSFYPNERGPYNFDDKFVNEDGTLQNPEERWGGIMQALQTTDFEATNYEYIEFWVLNPFKGRTTETAAEDGANHNNGKLYIQLGEISEDILKDGQLLFENGLPTTKAEAEVNTSVWGETPTINILTNAFDREVIGQQDLGYDGIDDIQETQYFANYLQNIQQIVSPAVYDSIAADPANDNFVHPQNPRYVSGQTDILERHRYFGRAQGNSTGDHTQIATQRPETEDLNASNSLDDTESFFEYEIEMSKDAIFTGDEVNIGRNFITDSSITRYQIGENNIDATWIQFQIPLDEFTRKEGSIEDFRAIRFIRMYMTGFAEPITLRFARFGLVSNQWRKYKKSLYNGEDIESFYDDDISNEEFSLSVVNIEENSGKYQMPPGVQRETTPGAQTQAVIQQNEQSLSMNVANLKDGDARAATKIENLDIRFFKKMEMWMHAEPATEGGFQEDQELVTFIRLGSDNNLNYYEYQLPLVYSEKNALTREGLWPEANKIKIWIENLTRAKLQRNERSFNNAQVYKYEDEGDTIVGDIFIKGNPDLSKIKNVMIGVKNPAMNDPFNAIVMNGGADQGNPVSAEIWFNELRLNGFDVEGGSAALAQLDIVLADFGQVNMSANMHTQGFGGIEQSITERYRDNYQAYSVSTGLELGKFLPKKSGIQVPFYAGITESFSTPEYDPYQGDIKVDDLVASHGGRETEAGAKALRDAQTYNKVKNYSFEGVRKKATKKGPKKRFHDISNFAVTYRFLEETNSNPEVEFNIYTAKTGILGYNFNNNPKTYKPFNKLVPSKRKSLRFVRDFNYQIAPKSLAFETTIRRDHTIMQMRTIDGGYVQPAAYDKQILWNRNYGLKYTPAKSITAKYNANTNARVFDKEKEENLEGMEFWRKLLTDQMMFNFNQTTNTSYKLPFSKFPQLNWLSGTAKYQTEYHWSLINEMKIGLYPDVPIEEYFGAVISNGNTRSINGSVNTKKLYKGLKAFGKQIGIDTYAERKKKFEAKEKAKKAKDPNYVEKKFKSEKNKNNKKKQTTGGAIFEKTITAVSKYSVNYSVKESTTMPGFLGTPDYFGHDNSLNAPGYPFTFGVQPYKMNKYNPFLQPQAWGDYETSKESGNRPYDWFVRNQSQNWFSQNDNQTIEILRTRGTDLSMRMTIIPIKKLNIDLDWKRTTNDNYSVFFVETPEDISDPDSDFWTTINPLSNGTYKVSFISINTAFQKAEQVILASGDTVRITQSDHNFLNVYRPQASEALQRAWGTPDNDWMYAYYNAEGQIVEDSSIIDGTYKEGFGQTSQDVLIPSFIAAYTGKTIGEMDEMALKNPFPNRPLPNWKIRYTGLTQIKSIKKYFSRITINHGYKSSYSTSYIGEPRFDNTTAVPTIINPNSGNFYARQTISQVVISEQFSPLIGFDFQLKNGIQIRSSYGKSRNINLSFVNYQLNKTQARDIKFGFGYKIKGVRVPLRLQPIFGAVLKNSLDTKLDFAIRDNINLVYDLANNNFQPTSGSLSKSVTGSIGYKPNKNMDIKIFGEWRRNIPYVNNSFKTTNCRYGISFRYTL